MFKHGMRNHPLYRVWKGMKSRCQKPKSKGYANYGGRGIKVCDRWQTFINFRDDMLPSWQPGLTIDRINNDGDYYPENCRWATHREQQQNKREYRVSGEIPYRGVCLVKKKYYQAQIRANGKTIYLGTYPTPEEASAAYQKAREELKN